MKHRKLAIVITIIVAFIAIAEVTMIIHQQQVDKENRSITKMQGIANFPEHYTDPAPAKGSLEVVDYDITLLDSILKEKTVSGKYASGGSKPPKGYKEQLAKAYNFTDRNKDGKYDGIALPKHATVYLPYAYDPDIEYDIVYLVHGRGGDYQTWLGTQENPRPLKNILDNMIMNCDIDPVIVVCPELTYAYGLDDRIMDGMSHEVSHELMTAVESQYSTYAEEATPEGFEKSRDHRCMAGFSMGGSVTWHLLKDHPGYFRYYMPMSMALYFDRNGYSRAKNTIAVKALEKNITKAGYTSDDIMVYAATGTDDHKAEAIGNQVFSLSADTKLFNYSLSNSLDDGNIVFRLWPNRWHRYTESFPYIYDGLKQFFKYGGHAE